MKVLKAFVKPFEAPQRSVKKKLIFIFIQLSEMHGTGKVNSFLGNISFQGVQKWNISFKRV